MLLKQFFFATKFLFSLTNFYNSELNILVYIVILDLQLLGY